MLIFVGVPMPQSGVRPSHSSLLIRTKIFLELLYDTFRLYYSSWLRFKISIFCVIDEPLI